MTTPYRYVPGGALGEVAPPPDLIRDHGVDWEIRVQLWCGSEMWTVRHRTTRTGWSAWSTADRVRAWIEGQQQPPHHHQH